MSSKKPSAKAKRVAQFKSQLYSMDDSAFEREKKHRKQLKLRREQDLRDKACTSKNRYTSRSEAEKAIQDCAIHGKTGLHCYKCEYCNGWHLTSKAQHR